MKTWSLIILMTVGMKFISPVPRHQYFQVVVGGKVIDAQSNQAIAGVHLYIEAGEEEAFSDRSGKFRIQSWKKFPITIHAEHKDYQKQTLQVNSAGESLEIKLKKK